MRKRGPKGCLWCCLIGANGMAGYSVSFIEKPEAFFSVSGRITS